LQENPDFYASEEIVFSSVSLLSRKFHDGKLLALLEKTLQECNCNILLDYYNIKSKDNVELLYLTRKVEHNRYHLRKVMQIPKFALLGKINGIC
jgi:hypothetical protein